jgi:two-component system response regulator VicR
MANKVLIVEDEPTLLETLEYNLIRQGYQVCSAADGPTALEAARQEQPDPIVLDVMLPGMDGFEVGRILRQEMSVPILMLTARDEVADETVYTVLCNVTCRSLPLSNRWMLGRRAHNVSAAVPSPWIR